MRRLNLGISSCFVVATVATSSLILVQYPSFAAVNQTSPTPTAPQKTVVNRGITETQVLAAQRAWGEALVSLSRTYETKGIEAARALAGTIIDEAYGHQFGVVLFRPTLTQAPQAFRTTRAGALAYFVGGDPAFPRDTGFARKGWRNVEIRNAGIFIVSDTATTMGNVILTDRNGTVTTVYKTWQFIQDDTGRLRIILHHSSLPHSG